MTMQTQLVSGPILLALMVSFMSHVAGQDREIAYVIRDRDYLNFVYAVGLADDFDMDVVQRTKIAVVRQQVEGELRVLGNSPFAPLRTRQQYLSEAQQILDKYGIEVRDILTRPQKDRFLTLRKSGDLFPVGMRLLESDQPVLYFGGKKYQGGGDEIEEEVTQEDGKTVVRTHIALKREAPKDPVEENVRGIDDVLKLLEADDPDLTKAAARWIDQKGLNRETTPEHADRIADILERRLPTGGETIAESFVRGTPPICAAYCRLASKKHLAGVRKLASLPDLDRESWSEAFGALIRLSAPGDALRSFENHAGDVFYQMAASAALNKLGRSHEAGIAAMLSSKDERVRKVAADSLRRIGSNLAPDGGPAFPPPAIPPMPISPPPPAVAAGATRAIPAPSNPAPPASAYPREVKSVDDALAVLRSAPDTALSTAFDWLMKAEVDASRSKEVVQALQSRKEATGAGFHWYLSQPLARWAGSKEHVPVLVQMVGDRTDRARAEALQHLIRLDAKKAIDLVEAKADDAFLRMFFGQALQGMGAEGEAIALQLLSREKHEVIALGLQYLRTNGTPKAIPQIQQLAQRAEKNGWTLIHMQAKSAIRMLESRVSGSR